MSGRKVKAARRAAQGITDHVREMLARSTPEQRALYFASVRKHPLKGLMVPGWVKP